MTQLIISKGPLCRGTVLLLGMFMLESKKQWLVPSKIEWDLTTGPLSKLLELEDTQV